MFFELTGGILVNLNHITTIPRLSGNGGDVLLKMIDNTVLHVTQDDASEIRCLLKED